MPERWRLRWAPLVLMVAIVAALLLAEHTKTPEPRAGASVTAMVAHPPGVAVLVEATGPAASLEGIVRNSGVSPLLLLVASTMAVLVVSRRAKQRIAMGWRPLARVPGDVSRRGPPPSPLV